MKDCKRSKASTKDLIVIAYINGKAIVQDELEQLFYLECEPNEAPVGTVVEEVGLASVENLSEEEQEQIKASI